jgi:hypothetical protein
MNLDTAPSARSIELTPPQTTAKARVGTAAGKRQRGLGVATRSHAQQQGPAVDDEVELYNVHAQVWVFQGFSRHNFSKNGPWYLKMVYRILERRVWQFYTICDKNQLLKVKLGKLLWQF